MSKGLHAVKPATEVVEFTKEHLVPLLELSVPGIDLVSLLKLFGRGH